MSQPARAVWIEIIKAAYKNCESLCHSLRGLCGLKSLPPLYLPCGYNCHSLRGLCGLKFDSGSYREGVSKSQPARAVWIEIHQCLPEGGPHRGHSLRGLCGLKWSFAGEYMLTEGHSLRGLCGLK